MIGLEMLYNVGIISILDKDFKMYRKYKSVSDNRNS